MRPIKENRLITICHYDMELGTSGRFFLELMPNVAFETETKGWMRFSTIAGRKLESTKHYDYSSPSPPTNVRCLFFLTMQCFPILNAAIFCGCLKAPTTVVFERSVVFEPNTTPWPNTTVFFLMKFGLNSEICLH